MHISLDSALGRQRRLNSVGESVFQIAPDAAAGYSLRSLTGGDPSVVRVRRESDNGERDFRSSEINSGAMVRWVNEQITPPLDLRELTATGRDGPIIEAAAAYSLRSLSDSYTGSVVDVRRSSDGALRSFTAAEVTDGTLVTWVLDYDASSLLGNAQYFNGTNAYVDTGIAADLPPTTSEAYEVTFAISEYPSTDRTMIGCGTNGEGERFTVTKDGYLGLFVSAKQDKEFTVAVPLNTAMTARLEREGTVIRVYVDGELLQTTTAVSPKTTTANWLIGRGPTGGTFNYFEGAISRARYELNGSLVFEWTYSNGLGTASNLVPFTGQGFGGTEGTVSKWYDQSTTSGVPNSNHAVQTSTGSQPKIVDGGTLVTGGLTFDGVNDYFTCPSLYSANLSVFTKLTTDNTNSANFMRLLQICDGSDSFQITRGGDVDIGDFLSKNTSFQASSVGFNHGSISGNSLLTSITSGSATESYANGSLRSNADDVLGDGGNTTTTIGARTDLLSSTFFNNAIAEIIIYSTDQTGNRTALEANIGEVYGIAGIPAYDDSVNGFVETWYDQSGNGNNATQLTANLQPRIVIDGELIMNAKGFPSIAQYRGGAGNANRAFVINNGLPVLNSTHFAVTQYNRQFSYHLTGTAAAGSSRVGRYSSDQFRIAQGGTSATSGAVFPTSVVKLATVNNAASGGTTTGFVNGVQAFSVNLADPSSTGLVYKYLFRGDNDNNGPLLYSEFIYYSSDQSANRPAIEANINNQYDIY